MAAPAVPAGDEQRQWQGQGEQGAEGPLYFEQAVAEVSYEQRNDLHIAERPLVEFSIGLVIPDARSAGQRLVAG